MRKLRVVETERGLMYAHDDGSIHEDYSEHSVIHINYDYFVVNRNGVKIDFPQDKAPGLFYVATHANKVVELVKNGVQLDLALNKIDTEGLNGAINFAVDCEELEHIPEISERLNQLPNKLIAAVNEPLKAKEKQIAGIKATIGTHRTKTVVEAFIIVNKVNEELKSLNSIADVCRSTGLDKNKVQRAYEIVEKVGGVKNLWLTLKGTMPYEQMIRIIAKKTDVHITNVEEWISELKAINPEYLIEI